MDLPLALDFSDVPIKPLFTTLSSRSEVNLESNFIFKYSPKTLSCIPIMAANMDTIGTMEVMKVLAPSNLFTVLHKFIPYEEYEENKEFLKKYEDNYAISVGLGIKEIERLEKLDKLLDFKTICIDVANGYMEKLSLFCLQVREKFPDKIIIAGNVVCRDMTGSLIKDGKVDIVKVGIGPGSSCTTRLKTGVGVPQFTAITECNEMARILGGHVISDGGITCPGDLGKAFGTGSSFVMIGGQFSGHDENPGEIISEGDKNYKAFYGMSSSHAMKKNYGKVNDYRTGEGRFVKVPYRGALIETVGDFLGGLRSTCTYVGARNLADLSLRTRFIRVNNQFNKSLV